METLDLKKAELDDIVFENRNKTYGGYELRRRYGNTILLAFLIASVTFSSIFLIRLFLQRFEKAEEVVVKPKEKKVVEMIDVSIDPKTPPPPPLPEMEIPKIETVKFVPIEVAKTNEEVKEEKVATQKELAKPFVDSGSKCDFVLAFHK